MADAAKTNREEQEHRVSGFSLMEPVGKLSLYWKHARSFLHDVRVEMRQVTWPTRREAFVTTWVVIVTVAFFGVFFFGVDSGVSWLVQRAIKFFAH